MKSTAFSLSRPLGLFGVLLLLSMIFRFSFSPVHPPVYAEANAPDVLGSISGVVRNETGEPLAGMQLTLYIYFDRSTFWHTSRAITTDNLGRYRFATLPAGTYHVGVTDPTGNYAKTFYTDQPTVWEATDIFVNGPAVTGIDFTLAVGGVITGVVLAADDFDGDGGPLLNTYVTLYQKVPPLHVFDGRVYEWLYSEDQWLETAQSAFQLRGLRAGYYRVCATNYNDTYHSWHECYDNVSNVQKAQTITVTAGNVISNVVITLGDGADRGVIQGRVTSAQAEPLANIGVYIAPFDVLAPPVPSDNLPPFAYRYYTSTAGDGSYTVRNLDIGKYLILFHDATGRYRYEYYDHVTYGSNAVPIQVTQPATTTTINAQLALGAHLTGTITLFGQPAPLTRVTAHKLESDHWFAAATALSDLWTGGYDIGGLPAGTYRLSAASSSQFIASPWSAFYGGTEWATATALKLATAEIRPHLDINLTQGPRFDGAISGRVTATGSPLAGIKVSLYTRPEHCCNPLMLDSQLTYATTDQDGRYQIAGLTDGIYYVRYEDPSGQHAALFYPNQPTLDFDQSVVTNDVEPVTAIDAELPPAGTVQGQIRALVGEIPPALTMLAVLTDPPQMAPYQTGDQTSFVYRDTPVNADGTFALPGLYPGTYHICVTTQLGYGLDCYGGFNEYSSFTSGQAITVTAGQTVTAIDILWGPDHKQYLPVITR